MPAKKYPFTRAALDEAKRDAEASGRTVFWAKEWDTRYARGLTLEEGNFGWLQGMGCEYRFYHRGDGTVVTTYQPSGPWPWASIEYVLSDDQPYEASVMTVLAADMLDNYSVDEITELLSSVADAVKAKAQK